MLFKGMALMKIFLSVTRNKSALIELTKVRLESARKYSRVIPAKIGNSKKLSIAQRKITTF